MRNVLLNAGARRALALEQEVLVVLVDGGDGRGGLDDHPDLVAEVALFLDEDDQDFLLKG